MQTELSQFTAIVGMDWADKKHDVCVRATGSRRRETYQIQHKVDKIDEWARSLHRRHGGPIAVALELSKGPIVSALQKYDFFVIFPIDPTTLANYRKTFTLSGAKDDPTDAELALDLLGRAATTSDERSCSDHQPVEKCSEAVLSTGFGVVRPYRHTAVL